LQRKEIVKAAEPSVRIAYRKKRLEGIFGWARGSWGSGRLTGSGVLTTKSKQNASVASCI